MTAVGHVRCRSLQRFFNALPARFAHQPVGMVMTEGELVYALAVRPATPRQQWHARLVCADGGRVAEFETLAELVHYLAQASLLGPFTPTTGVR